MICWVFPDDVTIFITGMFKALEFGLFFKLKLLFLSKNRNFELPAKKEGIQLIDPNEVDKLHELLKNEAKVI